MRSQSFAWVRCWIGVRCTPVMAKVRGLASTYLQTFSDLPGYCIAEPDPRANLTLKLFSELLKQGPGTDPAWRNPLKSTAVIATLGGHVTQWIGRFEGGVWARLGGG